MKTETKQMLSRIVISPAIFIIGLVASFVLTFRTIFGFAGIIINSFVFFLRNLFGMGLKYINPVSSNDSGNFLLSFWACILNATVILWYPFYFTYQFIIGNNIFEK